MTAEYSIALEASRTACAKYAATLADYRSGKVGDAEYLAARVEFLESEKAFDAAFAKEVAA